MTQPLRLRLSRRKGFDLQAHSLAVNGLPAVSVARGAHSIFGNPFVVGKDGDRKLCVDLFGHMLNGYIALAATPSPSEIIFAKAAILGNIRRLEGKNLACWCALDGKPCHADILLEITRDPKKLALCDEMAGRTVQASGEARKPERASAIVRRTAGATSSSREAKK